MSTLEKIKTEVVSGGSAHENPPDERADRTATVVGLGAWLALFVWLAFVSWWMFAFVIGVLISVFLHEVGHFWTARRSGMKVTQFFIGFGPRVWSTHRTDAHGDRVEYGLRAIPLGAFVKIIGMSSVDEIPADLEHRTYRASTFPRRMWVITAGSVMHMIIATVLIVGVYAAAGAVREQGFVEIAGLSEPSAAVPRIPAVDAGIKSGDVLITIGGKSVVTADDVGPAIAAQPVGSTFDVVVSRDGRQLTLSVTSVANPNLAPDEPSTSFLGIRSDSLERQNMSFVEALGEGPKDLTIGVGQAVRGVIKVVNPVNVWQHLTDTSDDPSSKPGTLVGAARVSDDFGRFDGWAGLLSLLAAVNVSVGVFNMFPLLPLDGGHAAIAVYERLRSRRGRPYRADINKLMPVVAITVAILAFMFLVGLYLDIARPQG